MKELHAIIKKRKEKEATVTLASNRFRNAFTIILNSEFSHKTKYNRLTISFDISI